MTMQERMESPLRTHSRAPVEPPAGQPRRPSGRLKLRALTGWEEEYIEQHQDEANTAGMCNEVLARCLVAPGEDPGQLREAIRELLVAERDRELVALRLLSLGPGVKAQIVCPKCGQTSEAEFSLDVLPLDFEPPPRQVAVEMEGVGEVVVRLPTAGDQEDLLDAGLQGEAERRTHLIARCLQRYGHLSGPFDVDFCRSLPVRERTAIEGAIERSLPDLDLEMDVECSYCGASIAAPFDVSSFFFSN